jgi:hypothetical protein
VKKSTEKMRSGGESIRSAAVPDAALAEAPSATKASNIRPARTAASAIIIRLRR